MKLRVALALLAGMGCRSDPAAPLASAVRFDSTSVSVNVGHRALLGVTGGGRRLAWSTKSVLLDVERDGSVTWLEPGDGWVFASDGVTTDSVLVHVRVRLVAIAAGTNVTCARSDEGRVLCWGSNLTSTLGDSVLVDATSPHLLVGDSGFHSLVVGGGTVCGFSGGLVCWGYNGVGQVGDGTTRDRIVPVRVSDTLGLVSATLGAGATSCAGDFQRHQFCWGWNAYNQLLDGSGFNWRRPIAMPAGLQQIATGGGQVCGLDSLGAAWCWGRNDFGQVGDGSVGNRAAPVPVAGNMVFTLVAAGREHTCALSGGLAWCWGHNDRGQLGRDDVFSSAVPLPVQSSVRFDTLVSSAFHTCGLAAGMAYCWGANAFGQLGREVLAGSPAVLPVSGAPLLQSISAGFSHTCGLGIDGAALCWGADASGQLGNGQRLDTPTPQRVAYQP